MLCCVKRFDLCNCRRLFYIKLTELSVWNIAFVLWRVIIQGVSGGEVKFWEVISVIVRNKFVRTSVWFWMVTDIEWFESTNTKAVWLVVSKEKLFTVNSILISVYEQSLQRKVGYTKKKKIHTHFAAAVLTKKCEDQLIRTTCDLRTRAAKFTEADGGIFECVIVNRNKFALSV